MQVTDGGGVSASLTLWGPGGSAHALLSVSWCSAGAKRTGKSQNEPLVGWNRSKIWYSRPSRALEGPGGAPGVGGNGGTGGGEGAGGGEGGKGPSAHISDSWMDQEE